MTPDPKVFALVQSLTSAEKRFYVFFSLREEIGKTNTLILFEGMCEAVEQLAKYSERTSKRSTERGSLKQGDEIPKNSLHKVIDEWVVKRRSEGKSTHINDKVTGINSDLYKYIEKWIIENLPTREGKTVVNNFANVKDDLYKHLLKVMRTFNSHKSIVITLREVLDDIRFVLGRGLYKQAEYMLQQAKKTAKKYEYYRLLLDILELEKQLTYDRSETGLGQKIDSLSREATKALEYLQTEISLQVLYDKMFVQLRLHLTGVPRDTTVLHKIIHTPLLQDSRKIKTFTSWRLYNGIFSMYHRIHNEMDACFSYEKKIMELWADKSHQHQIDDNLQTYMRMLANFSGLCVRLRKMSDYETAIALLRNAKCETLDDRAEQFQNIAHLITLHALNSGLLYLTNEDIDFLDNGLRQYEGKVNPSRLLSICYNLVALFFISGKFHRSLDWLNEILDRKKYEVRLDIRITAHLLEPIIHYELDNDIVENCCRAAERFIKNERIRECEREKEYNPEKDCTGEGKLHEYERKFFSFIKRLPGIIDKKKKKYEAEKVKQSIYNYLDEHAGQAPLVQEILLWLESIITGKPIAELFREQLRESAEDEGGDVAE